MTAEKEKKDDLIIKAKNLVVNKIDNLKIEELIKQTFKMPQVKVDRAEFLRLELQKYYPYETVKTAVRNNPAYAGIKKSAINEIAKQVINMETRKVTAISIVAGVPGGFGMAAAIPADLAQYFGAVIRTLQELAYLYGFPEFEIDGSGADDDTMDQILILLGVMFGVREASKGVDQIAGAEANKVSRGLVKTVLAKSAVYPIVRNIAGNIGIRMSKEIFASGVSKAVPVIGGAVSGGITHATFQSSALRLKNSLSKQPLSDAEYYKDQQADQDGQEANEGSAPAEEAVSGGEAE